MMPLWAACQSAALCCSSFSMLFVFLLYDEHTCSTNHQQHSCHKQHVALCAADKFKQYAAQCSGYNLRHAYRSVEQSEVDTQVTVALEGVCHQCERHGKYCRPCTSDKEICHKQHVLVMDERHEAEAYAAKDKAEGVSHLAVAYHRQYHSTRHCL